MPRLPKLTPRQTRPLAIGLAFVAIAMATSRFLPPTLPSLPRQIDMGVVALFVPLCALMLAIVAQVLTMTLNGAVPEQNQPHARAIAHWRE
jgi:H+/gluconate symporter-like permease